LTSLVVIYVLWIYKKYKIIYNNLSQNSIGVLMVLLDVIWSIFMFFLMVAWIWTVISVITDIFRSKDLGGWGKGLWMLAVIMTPWLGVLAYLIVRGDSMHERTAEAFIHVAEQQR